MPLLKGRTVKRHTDCSNVENITQVGSKSDNLQALALDIYHVCACNGISLEVEWIPKAQMIEQIT